MVDGPDSAWRNRAPGPQGTWASHGNAARQAMDGLWMEVCGQQKQSNDPGNNQHNPQYANYWAPLTRKRHIPPHSAQPQHTNDWAPRTRKRHQQEHRPQRPTERSDPTQHAKGRTGDCPGPRKGATTRRNVTQGGGGLEARNLSQLRNVHTIFTLFAAIFPPLLCACPPRVLVGALPCVSPVQRCCSLRLREVWLWHPNFFRNFPQFFGTGFDGL